MADLYHLLDELEENELHDADKDNRRLTVETAATEAMSEDFGGEDDEGDNFGGTGNPEVPLVLQDAQRRRYDDANRDDEADGDYNGFLGVAKASKGGAADIFGSSEDQHVPDDLLYEQLHRHWLQERHCPELLEYDEGMVAALLDQFEERQEGIDQLTESSEAVELLMANLAQQDLDRAKFVLSDWLTQRLFKIEAHPLHMRDKISHMSDEEIEYLQNYGALMEHHLKTTVLDAIPQAWQALDEPDMIDRPDYEGYHFWLVKETIVDKNEFVHEEGSCLVAPYIDMKANMIEKKVELLI